MYSIMACNGRWSMRRTCIADSRSRKALNPWKKDCLRRSVHWRLDNPQLSAYLYIHNHVEVEVKVRNGSGR